LAHYGLGGAQRVILYAGTFEPYQGLELLIDGSPKVLAVQQQARFLCLGGTQRQVAALQERAHQRGVAAAFILPGTVSPEEVDAHFRIASVLVSPRVSGTNTPLKIYSYLRSGVPILATNILSHTQVLTPEVALLVEPRPDALAAGIVTLLTDSGLCQRLVENASRLAQEVYSPQAYYTKVAEVFSFLASRARGSQTPASSVQS
jgi:glycosyltransferase involved in cell wall biosynthesis